MAKKISKIHARLLGLKPASKSPSSNPASRSFSGGAITKPVLPDNKLTTKPQVPHVVWMSLESAMQYDSADYAVISIGNSNRTADQYPKFKTDNVLYLDFNPSFELNGWITREHSTQLREFYDKNKEKNFLVHCTYGSQRSPGIAYGIYEALRSLPNQRELYKWSLKDGFWEKKQAFTGEYDERCAHVAYSALTKSRRLQEKKE